MRRYARTILFIASSPVACVRVARWTTSTTRRLRRHLDGDGLEATARLSGAPAASPGHRRVVVGVLRLAQATCLVRSAVLQRWDADHGRPRALVIGVTSSAGGRFAAHAWLDGDQTAGRYVELHRRPPPFLASTRTVDAR